MEVLKSDGDAVLDVVMCGVGNGCFGGEHFWGVLCDCRSHCDVLGVEDKGEVVIIIVVIVIVGMLSIMNKSL